MISFILFSYTNFPVPPGSFVLVMALMSLQCCPSIAGYCYCSASPTEEGHSCSPHQSRVRNRENRLCCLLLDLLLWFEIFLYQIINNKFHPFESLLWSVLRDIKFHVWTKSEYSSIFFLLKPLIHFISIKKCI